MISVVPNDVAQYYARYAMVSVLPVELPVSMVNLRAAARRSRPMSAAVRGDAQLARRSTGGTPRLASPDPGSRR
ncbi:hypothetical protein ACU4GD_13090 [Cupriavidus basilensis]